MIGRPFDEVALATPAIDSPVLPKTTSVYSPRCYGSVVPRGRIALVVLVEAPARNFAIGENTAGVKRSSCHLDHLVPRRIERPGRFCADVRALAGSTATENNNELKDGQS